MEERCSKVIMKAVVVFETMALAEDSVLLRYEAEYLGVRFPTMRANMAALSSKSKLFDTLNVNLETPGADYPLTRRRMPEG